MRNDESVARNDESVVRNDIPPGPAPTFLAATVASTSACRPLAAASLLLSLHSCASPPLPRLPPPSLPMALPRPPLPLPLPLPPPRPPAELPTPLLLLPDPLALPLPLPLLLPPALSSPQQAANRMSNSGTSNLFLRVAMSHGQVACSLSCPQRSCWALAGSEEGGRGLPRRSTGWRASGGEESLPLEPLLLLALEAVAPVLAPLWSSRKAAVIAAASADTWPARSVASDVAAPASAICACMREFVGVHVAEGWGGGASDRGGTNTILRLLTLTNTGPSRDIAGTKYLSSNRLLVTTNLSPLPSDMPISCHSSHSHSIESGSTAAESRSCGPCLAGVSITRISDIAAALSL